MEMKDWQVVDAPVDKSRPADGEEPHHVAFHTAAGPDDAAEGDSGDLGDRQPRASGSRLSAPIVPSPSPDLQPVASRLPDASRISKDVVPAAIGRETCPICIVDFEEGDDLRLLPCEGKHKFHQECVDPWLLELSSSCPICRQDFQALETMLSGEMDNAYYSSHATEYQPNLHAPTGTSPAQMQGNRFSRYLRFARRRRNHRDGDSDIQDHRNSHHLPTDTSSRHSSQDNSV